MNKTQATELIAAIQKHFHYVPVPYNDRLYCPLCTRWEDASHMDDCPITLIERATGTQCICTSREIGAVQWVEKHCSICRAKTTGAPLCDRCARNLRRDCKLAHEAIARRVRLYSGAIRNLRRDEELLAEYDERAAQHEANREAAAREAANLELSNATLEGGAQ